MIFPLCQPCATSHHLAVQGTNLCGAQHHHTIYIRTVPALCEQHAVAQHVVLAVSEILQNLFPVFGFTVDLCRTETVLTEHVPEFLGCLDQRQEYHCFAIGAVLCHFCCNLIQIGIQRRGDVTGFVISGSCPHMGEINLHRHSQCPDGR